MNWKLIFLLSFFGIAMAILSLLGWKQGTEVAVWTVIF